MGVCICSIVCCTLLYVHSSLAIILMGKRELVALLSLSSCCLVSVVFSAMSWVCRQFVIVVFPDHTHLIFFHMLIKYNSDRMISNCEIIISNLKLNTIVNIINYSPNSMTNTRNLLLNMLSDWYSMTDFLHYLSLINSFFFSF